EPPRSLEPTVNPDLEQICLKCLRREPDQRYATAAELAEELECWLEGKPVAARPLSSWGRGLRWVQRQPVLAALSVAVLVYCRGLASVFGPVGGDRFVARGTGGFCSLLLFFPVYMALRPRDSPQRQLERLTAALEGGSPPPAPVELAPAEPAG